MQNFRPSRWTVYTRCHVCDCLLEFGIWYTVQLLCGCIIYEFQRKCLILCCGKDWRNSWYICARMLLYMLYYWQLSMCAVPGAPVGLGAVTFRTNCNAAQLTWNPPSSAVITLIHYSICRCDPWLQHNHYRLSFLLTNGVGNLTLTSLQCCSSYSYQVVARNSAGEGIPSQTFSFLTYGESEGKWNWPHNSII